MLGCEGGAGWVVTLTAGSGVGQQAKVHDDGVNVYRGGSRQVCICDIDARCAWAARCSEGLVRDSGAALCPRVTCLLTGAAAQQGKVPQPRL